MLRNVVGCSTGEGSQAGSVACDRGNDAHEGVGSDCYGVHETYVLSALQARGTVGHQKGKNERNEWMNEWMNEWIDKCKINQLRNLCWRNCGVPHRIQLPKSRKCEIMKATSRLSSLQLTLSLPRVINFKFPPLPHQKYHITQHGESAFHSLLRRGVIFTIPILTTSLIHFSSNSWENGFFELSASEEKCPLNGKSAWARNLRWGEPLGKQATFFLQLSGLWEFRYKSYTQEELDVATIVP